MGAFNISLTALLPGDECVHVERLRAALQLPRVSRRYGTFQPGRTSARVVTCSQHHTFITRQSETSLQSKVFCYDEHAKPQGQCNKWSICPSSFYTYNCFKKYVLSTKKHCISILSTSWRWSDAFAWRGRDDHLIFYVTVRMNHSVNL